MKKLFQLIEEATGTGASEKSVSLGIRITIGDQESVFPVSPDCRSVEVLSREIKVLQKELEDAFETGKRFLQGKGFEGGKGIDDDLSPEEVWSLLSDMAGEEPFVEHFNAMAEERRRAVAEYILTSCNIFSGKAAVFSARYDSDSALLK
jgi:hypothetical protein